MRAPKQWLADQREAHTSMVWPKPPETAKWHGRRIEAGGPIVDDDFAKQLSAWQWEQRQIQPQRQLEAE